MASASGEEHELPDEDREKLKHLTCPVPENEVRRLTILHQTKLLDSSPNEATFDRFTHLASLIFNMPVSVITLVDVDRVWLKSRLGVDWTDICRNESFDAYTILPESSEVYVVSDIAGDSRFHGCELQHGALPIRFYAGAAIMVEDVKIGALCILDTEPHLDFSLEDKENLLDLCVGVSQLAQERRQRALDLDNERANIVVSMMHNLRTPMTTLNFATSLLAAEAQKLRPSGSTTMEDLCYEDDDGSDDGNTMATGTSGTAKYTPAATPAAFRSTGEGEGSKEVSPSPAVDRAGSGDSEPNTHDTPLRGAAPSAVGYGPTGNNSSTTTPATPLVGGNVPDVDAMEPMFSTFDVCYREIAVALKQLGLIVDSTLTLGQAVVKVAEQGSPLGPRKNHSSLDLACASTGMSEKSSVANNSGLPNLSTHGAGAPLTAGANVNVSGRGSVSMSPKYAAGASRPLLGARPIAAPSAEAGPFYPEMDGCKYVPCDMLEHVESLYRTLIPQVTGTSVSWEVDPALLSLGRHASYPEAVTLVLLSALGQLHGQHKSVRVRFHFERCEHDEDLEYPEVAHKLIEGTFVVRVQAYTRAERSTPSLAASAAAAVAAAVAGAHSGKESVHGVGGSGSKHISFSSAVDNGGDGALAALHHQHSELGGASTASNKTSMTSGTIPSTASAGHAAMALPHVSMDTSADQTDQYIAQYNLLSVNKVLRTVNGGCHEYLEQIPGDVPSLDPEDGFIEPLVYMPTQEYWIPCKILPSEEALQRTSVKAYLEKSAESAKDAALNVTVKRTFTRGASQGGVGTALSNEQELSRSRLLSESFSLSSPTSMKVRPTMTSSGSMRGGLGGSPSEKRIGVSGSFSAGLAADAQPGAATATVGTGEASTLTGAGASPANAEPKTLRVLIIEDTIPVQKLLSRWMQKAKCKVSCAGNGSIGLSMLMTGCFDIVFVDFLMPVMLGITTMQLFQTWVHENAATNEIAAYNSQLLIVGMSATALESEQEAAFNYGMHFFCPKPANMDVLGLMLDAKRTCATNEEALDVICAATGTDYLTESLQEYMNADMAEGDEYAEEEGVEGQGEGGQEARAHRLSGHNLHRHQAQEGPTREDSWVDLTPGAGAFTDQSALADGESSAKASSKSSNKGSAKDSHKGSTKVDGTESAVGLSTAPSSASLTGSVAGNVAGGGGGGGGSGAHTSIASLSGPGHISHAKAVTDSKSAAMWSVFRSYRQSTRATAASQLASTSPGTAVGTGGRTGLSEGGAVVLTDATVATTLTTIAAVESPERTG